MPHADAPLMTTSETARDLGVSASTVRRKAEAWDADRTLMWPDALEYDQKLPGPNGAFLFRRAYIEQLPSRATVLAARH